MRLRGGSGYRWGSDPKVTSEELKKNVQRVLEKNPSGVMGRDLRRMYKDVRSLP